MNVQRDSCCYCCSSSYLFHICTYKANVQFFHTIDLCRCHFVFSRTFFFAITFISYRKLWYRCKNVLPRPTEFWFETACCLLRIKNIKWNEIWIRFGAGIFQCTLHTFGFYHCVFHEMYIGTVVMNHTAKNDRWFKTNWKPEKQLCSVPLTTLHRAFSIYLSGSIRICLTIWCYSNQKKRLRPKHYIRTKIVVLWTGHYNVLWTSFVHVLPLGFHHWHIICNWFVVIEHRKQSQLGGDH